MIEPKEGNKSKIIVPGHYCSMAAKLLRKYGFKQSYVGFEYWKHLIALMLHDNNYLSKSLNSDIYPYIAGKCNSTIANVESQLRFSLKDAMDKEYTITSFLNKILNNEESEEKEMENEKQEQPKESTVINEETLIQVPIRILLKYNYMKRIYGGSRFKAVNFVI